ncbi:L-2-amino-thiazoline-4-carboxylic acid hydrolase [Butyrivibrio sp. AC2005]|uniref:L-2-amino-thiazoline-4-carboxylic acid hydrolase n=1 Tax=Butyrivibrio sp. AC2005 TaxID=1280672 RepID=UPI00040B21F9|nr:L-2-amino-thiazoline-4-carboxylic acid hydrolase [Butyrivibrio sp. AC2005]
MSGRAEEIMQKKGFIKAEMDKVFTMDQSDKLWTDATIKLSEFLEKYESLPKGVHTHTDSRIFPSSAIYLTIKPVIGADAAYKVIEDAAITGCAGIQTKLARLMRVPVMRGLFVKMWDPLTKKIFGPSCGFQNVFYPNKKGEYRMDVTECPYRRYFTELGCPELTKIFCGNDDRVYGNLPGLEFIRTGTLGRGADKCDFYLRLKK